MDTVKKIDLRENIKTFFSLIRAKQYVKNLLIFAPLFFASKFFNELILIKLFVAFVGFSLVTSFIYILNDINDVELDKLHPTKSKRPIASGKVSPHKAIKIAVLCLALGLCLVGKMLLIPTLIYLVLNLLYVYKIKNYALIDVVTISVGYLIRLFIGGMVANVVLSHWIVNITFLLALFLAISKRYDDLEYNEKLRESLKGYSVPFIKMTMTMLASMIIVAYVLYTISPEVIGHFSCEYVYATSIFVLVGLLRYLQLTFVYKKSGSPTNIFYSDNFLKITMLLWVVSFVCVIYL